MQSATFGPVAAEMRGRLEEQVLETTVRFQLPNWRVDFATHNQAFEAGAC
jgi:hypothetical protein